ncbi:MAG TPA: RecX family transcriptional regulator [Patescibacteria group bacterium]
MPKITSIKQQKDKNRVNVYLDGKFGFGLDLENFVKLGLKVEQELTNEQIDEIVRKSEHQKVLDKLLNFATFRLRSIHEVRVWLRRKKIPEDMHEDLFNTLKRLELINDEKFAKWWIDQRMSFRPKGKKALKFELLKKGIDRKIIDAAFGEVVIDEKSIALELLKKRKSKWEKLEEMEAKQKMYSYLGARGFDWELIKNAVDEYLKLKGY